MPDPRNVFDWQRQADLTRAVLAGLNAAKAAAHCDRCAARILSAVELVAGWAAVHAASAAEQAELDELDHAPAKLIHGIYVANRPTLGAIRRGRGAP